MNREAVLREGALEEEEQLLGEEGYSVWGRQEAGLRLDGSGRWWPCCQHEECVLILRQGEPWKARRAGADGRGQQVLSVGGGSGATDPARLLR